ncbi:hypothetical protein [Henriciella pelagia]|nr:hypothetical protein [Henriciella pelagia]
MSVLTSRKFFTPYGEKIAGPACNADNTGPPTAPFCTSTQLTGPADPSDAGPPATARPRPGVERDRHAFE